MTAVTAAPDVFALLAFNASNQLAVRRNAGRLDLAFSGGDLAAVAAQLEAWVTIFFSTAFKRPFFSRTSTP